MENQARKRRSPLLNSCLKGCTRISVLAAARSACSRQTRRPNARKKFTSVKAKTFRQRAAEGRTTKKQSAMKFTKYSKYVPDPAGEMSMEDLLSALSDYLLQSGFQNPYLGFYEMQQGEHTMEDLRKAIEQALESGALDDMLDMDSEQIEEMLNEIKTQGKMDELIDQVIQRMEQEDFINVDRPFENPYENSDPSSMGGQTGQPQGQVKF